MSEQPLPPTPAAAPAAPPPPAAPEPQRDTQTIAQHALETLERDAAPAAPEATEPAAPATSPPGQGLPAQATPAQVSAALAFLRAQGHETMKKDGRPNWLPVPTVEKMLGRFLDQHKAGWDTEKSAWETEKQRYRQAVAEVQRWRELVDSNPQGLLERLSELDPRYAALLRREAAQAPAEEDDPEPQADIDMGGGRWTYSTKAIKEVRAWERRQMERTMNERLAPLLSRAQAEEQAQRRQRVEAMLVERTSATLAKARTWPKFNENEAAILKVLQEDTAASEAAGVPPQLTVHDAYMQVVPQTFSADHNKVREQVLRELQAAPRSTAVSGNGAEPVRAPGPMTTEEIARRAMARLEGGRH